MIIKHSGGKETKQKTQQNGTTIKGVMVSIPKTKQNRKK
jgi:hypothetical protein